MVSKTAVTVTVATLTNATQTVAPAPMAVPTTKADFHAVVELALSKSETGEIVLPAVFQV